MLRLFQAIPASKNVLHILWMIKVVAFFVSSKKKQDFPTLLPISICLHAKKGDINFSVSNFSVWKVCLHTFLSKKGLVEQQINQLKLNYGECIKMYEMARRIKRQKEKVVFVFLTKCYYYECWNISTDVLDMRKKSIPPKTSAEHGLFFLP